MNRLIAAVLLGALLLGGCASAAKEGAGAGDAAPPAAASSYDTGSCRPWFVAPSRDWGEGAPNHSCWNRLWEVPAALVVGPLAIGFIAAPIWVPILLLH